MSYAQNPYQSPLGDFAALAAADERSTFITKTYIHLAGAIALFAALEAVILQTPGIAENFVGFAFGTRFGWLIVLGAFMLVSTLASNWAVSAVSPATQYAGLGLYVVAESIIFAPLLYIALSYDQLHQTNIIASAAVATLALFGGLTAAVFITRKDFSFLRTFLVFGGFAAMGFILVAILFQFPAWGHFRLCHDRPGLRLHSLRYVECAAPLSHRPARCRVAGLVCLGGPAVLVSRAVVHVAAGLMSNDRTRFWAHLVADPEPHASFSSRSDA